MAQGKSRIDEHQHQSDLFDWVNLQMNVYPELRYFHAIPNGAKLPYSRSENGTRFSRQAIFLKREGEANRRTGRLPDIPKQSGLL